MPYIGCDRICGQAAVEGGHDYLRRCGNLEDWEELSELKNDMKRGKPAEMLAFLFLGINIAS